MDLNRAKIYLDKINREFGRMSKDPENIATIDVDIMQSYIRDLYDAFLSLEIQRVVPQPRQETYTAPPVVRKTVEFTPERPVAPPVQSHPVPEKAPSAAPPPPVQVVEPPRQAAPPPPPPVREPEPVVPPLPVERHIAKPIVREPYSPTLEEIQAPKPAAPTVVSATSVYSDDTDALFEQKQARELSEKLAERPIEDLKKGIALNDKLLMTRELFGGNNQAFDDALTALNSCSGFEQAKLYLLQNCVNRFDWMDKNRIERAKEFIKLVRRRYK